MSFSLSPILICRGGIEIGNPTESINNSIDQSYTPDLLKRNIINHVRLIIFIF